MRKQEQDSVNKTHNTKYIMQQHDYHTIPMRLELTSQRCLSVDAAIRTTLYIFVSLSLVKANLAENAHKIV